MVGNAHESRRRSTPVTWKWMAAVCCVATVLSAGCLRVGPGDGPGEHAGPTIGDLPTATATATATLPAPTPHMEEEATNAPPAEVAEGGHDGPGALVSVGPLSAAATTTPTSIAPATPEAPATEPPTATATEEVVPTATPTLTPPPTSTPTPQPAAQAQPAELVPTQAVSDFYVPEASSGPLNGLEQRFFESANAERVAAGIAPLTLDPALTRVARTRSQQMADQGYFGHRDPYGYSMYVELLKHFGMGAYNWAAENLAMNNYGDAESAERAVVSLMNSPTHRDILLNPALTRLGVGLVVAPDGRKIYTMIFLG